MTDYRARADALLTAADAMHADPTLDADRALRLAIWGNADTELPGADEAKAGVHTDAITAIAERCRVPADDVPALPHGHAQMAARIEAARAAARAGEGGTQ